MKRGIESIESRASALCADNKVIVAEKQLKEHNENAKTREQEFQKEIEYVKITGDENARRKIEVMREDFRNKEAKMKSDMEKEIQRLKQERDNMQNNNGLKGFLTSWRPSVVEGLFDVQVSGRRRSYLFTLSA